MVCGSDSTCSGSFMQDLAAADIYSVALVNDITILSHRTHLIVARFGAPGVAATRTTL